jgi:hypothetical protein
MTQAKLDPRIPAELARPTPRPTRRVRGQISAGRILLLIFGAIWAVIAFLGVGDIELFSHGKPVPAVITGTEIISGRHGDSYYVYYTMEGADGNYSDYQHITEVEYDQTKANQPAQGIELHIGPWRFDRLRDFSYWDQRGKAICTFLVMLSGILGPGIYFAMVRPVFKRRLVSHGQAIIGRITQKTDRGARIDYEFQPPGGETRIGSMYINGSEYIKLQIDQEVAILYDPKRPWRNVAYQFGYYKVAPA